MDNNGDRRFFCVVILVKVILVKIDFGNVVIAHYI